MHCDNHNCQGDHYHTDCPLPPHCSGCNSPNHFWSECQEICVACGTTRHTVEFCIDFEPGKGGKPHNYPRINPKYWPFKRSYKTDLDKIQAGRSGRFGPFPKSPHDTPAPVPIVNFPGARPKFTSRLRATAPSFYPGSFSSRPTEDTPSMPALGPAHPNHLYPWAVHSHPRPAAEAPSVPTFGPTFPPGLQPSRVGFPPPNMGPAPPMAPPSPPPHLLARHQLQPGQAAVPPRLQPAQVPFPPPRLRPAAGAAAAVTPPTTPPPFPQGRFLMHPSIFDPFFDIWVWAFRAGCKSTVDDWVDEWVIRTRNLG